MSHPVSETVLGPAPVEYARRLWANVLDWYKNADTKAQVLLTIDGAFLSFLTGTAFTARDELMGIISAFGPETWLFLAAMTVFLAASIFAAIRCMRSRLGLPDDIRDHLDRIRHAPTRAERYPPEVMWFFGMIAQFPSRSRFQEEMRGVTDAFEVDALASQIHIVSRNVLKKHQWVNRGFALVAFSLVLFLGAGTSYVLRVDDWTPPEPAIGAAGVGTGHDVHLAPAGAGRPLTVEGAVARRVRIRRV